MTSTIVSQNLVKLANLPTLPILITLDTMHRERVLNRNKRALVRNRRALTRNKKALISTRNKQALIHERRALIRNRRILISEREALISSGQTLKQILKAFMTGDSPSVEAEALNERLRLTEESPTESSTETTEKEPQPLDPYSILRRKHEEEYRASAIHPDLMKNFETYDSNPQIMNEMLIGEVQRTNSGRVTSAYLHMYGGFNSGWIVRTEGSDYIQFKPDAECRRKAVDENGKEKEIKYENPAKFPTDIFRFRYIPVWLAKQLGCNVEGQRFWDWVNEFTGSLWITEGAKKTASLLSKGKLAVGLAGINNLYVRDADGNRVLIPALREAIKNKTEIVLSLDAPDKLTQIQPLISAYHSLKKLIHQCNPKCKIKMAVWDWHLGKGIDDVSAAGHWDKVKIVDYYEGLRFLNFNIPAVKRILGKEYLSLEDVGHLAARVVGIKAGKNSGKTHITAQYLKELIGENEKILNIGHRIKLSRSQAQRFRLYYLKDYVNEGEQVLAQTQISLCINSLTIKNGFNPDNWKGATVVLDEVVQLINHLIGSGTVKDLPEILDNFKHILLGAKKIILLDADLDHKTLKFLDELLGEEFNFFRQIKVYQFQKEVAKMPMTVRKCNNKNVGTLAFNEILDRLLEGKKVLAMTDSKSVKSALGVENLVNALKKEYLNRTGKELRGLAINADNTKNQGDIASQINTNLDIVYDYDLVIYTSVLGTGVSFEKAHFDVVVGAFVGGLSIDEILQGLYRYRVPIPRIVYIPGKGTQFKRDGSTYSFRENQFNTRKIKQDVLLGYQSIANEIPGDDRNLNYPCMNYHAQLRAIGRWESDNFLRLFLEKASEDYEVSFDDLNIKLPKPEVVKETIKEAVEKLADTRVSSEVIHNPEQYENMKAAETLPEKDFNNFDKTKVAKKYQLMDNEEVLSKELYVLDIEERNYHSQINIHYLMDNPDYAEMIGEEIVMRNDIDTKYGREPKIKVGIMNALGAKSLRTDEILDSTSPIIQSIGKKAEEMEKANPGFIKRHLGLNFNPKDLMTFATSLALKQGIEAETVGRKKLPSGERVSKKRFFIPDTIRYQIFEVWKENDEIKLLETQEYKLRQQIDKMTERAKSEDVTAEEIEAFDTLIPELQKQHDEIQTKRTVLTETRNEKRAERQSKREDEKSLAMGLTKEDLAVINSF